MTKREGPLSIAVVCESPADFEIATCLIDRVLMEQFAWFTEPSYYRQWRGMSTGEEFLRWQSVPNLARQHGIRPAGKFGGESGAMDAAAARKALLLLATPPLPPDAVILMRDTDGFSERCHGLQQARTDPIRHWPFPILIGAAHCKRESWVLAGFEAQNDDETERLRTARQRLGFHPCDQPERLAASDDDLASKRSAKKVLTELTDDDPERERRCFKETSLTTLRQRGRNCGLGNFIEYIEKRLIPVL